MLSVSVCVCLTVVVVKSFRAKARRSVMHKENGIRSTSASEKSAPKKKAPSSPDSVTQVSFVEISDRPPI